MKNNSYLWDFFKNIDWLLLLFILPVIGAGLLTMKSFGTSLDNASQNIFFEKQLIWLVFSLIIFFIFSAIDWRFLRRTGVIVTAFILTSFLLLTLFFLGSSFKGASRWFSVGGFTFQPSDFSKIVMVLILAKYFSRRHVEIAHFKHILISGFYALVFFTLVFFQPDLGSALIIFFIWLGVSIVAGISKKHLFLIFSGGLIIFTFFWFFVFHSYQKERIMSFLDPYANIQTTGYNAYQSVIAVGSGQVLGKGVGFGTQSRFQFLPEYETDFIFAAFSEEWGFLGSLILILLFCLIIWRVLANAFLGVTNFEILFGVGVAIFLVSQIFINIGMNIGLLPVTGITLPFMSYGGSHLLIEFSSLGILMGMRRYRRIAHRDDTKNEFFGL